MKDSLFITEEGQGPRLILLHGFLANSSLWETTKQELTKLFTVCSIDLFGHGNSANYTQFNSLTDVAKAILENYNEGFIVGHSMGGYIALELIEIGFNPLGIVLCNSTPYKDSDLKQKHRRQELDLIKKGKAQVLKTLFTHKQTQDSNLNNLINSCANLVSNSIMETYIRAMYNRKEYTAYQKYTTIPKLIIRGEDEDEITESVFWEKIVIQNSGHYSFLEKPKETSNVIIQNLIT